MRVRTRAIVIPNFFQAKKQMARKLPKRAKGRKKKKRAKGRKKKLSPWIKHVMKTYRANKSAGFSAAMRKAKKTYKRPSKK